MVGACYAIPHTTATTSSSRTQKKSWDVVNPETPETLKDHVGHHVELSAHVYADKGQIHVMKVKMLQTP